MDSAELNFIIRMRDEASAVIKSHADSIRQLSSAHGGLKDSAKDAETGLSALVNKSKEAAEAFGAMWAASELNEKTLGAWAEMEVAMTRLQAATGETVEGMDQLQGAIEGIAAHSLSQTNEQIAAVATAAAQLGIAGKSKIVEFTEVVSDLATVTGVSTTAITQGMSKILTATGETQDGAKAFGDVFAALADKTRGGGQALITTAQQITAMTGGLKMSSENILSISSAVEGLGLRSRTAGMAVGQTLTVLSNVAEKGGVQLQELAIATGMTADQFKELVKEDPSKAFTALLGVIAKVQASGAPLGDFLKQFGLGGRQIEIALGAAARQMDSFKKKAEEAHEAAAGGTALKDKKQPFDATLTARMHEASMAAKDFGEAIGKALEPLAGPLFTTIANNLHALSAVFEMLPGPAKTMFAAVVVGIPILVAAGTAWKFLSEVIMTGAGTFRSMYGPLGALVKIVQAFKGAATEAGVAMEEAGVMARAGGARFATAATEVEAASVALKAAGASAIVAGEEMAVAGEVGLASGAAMASGMAMAEKGALAAKASVLSLGGAFKWLAGAMLAADAGSFVGNWMNKNTPDLANKIAEWRDNSKIGGYIKSAGHAMGAQSPQDIENEKQAKTGELKKTDAESAEKDNAAKEAKGGEPSLPEQTSAPGASASDIAVFTQANALKLTALDALMGKGKQYEDQLKVIAQLEQIPDSVREQLHLGDQELSVLKNIIKAKQDALDPMIKMRQSWDDQLKGAQAVTKAQTDQLAIEKAVDDARRSNPRFSGADEEEMRGRMARNNAAAIKKGFDEQIIGLRQSAEMAGVLTQTQKSRLEIEFKIADAMKKQGFNPEQLASLQQALSLEQQIKDSGEQMDALNPQAKALRGYDEQNRRLQGRLDRKEITPEEKDREQTVLDKSTQGARDPIGKIVEDQKTELAQLAVIGDYKDAQLKTMQQIDALEANGLVVSGKTRDAMLQYNKAIQDAKAAQGSGFEGWADKIGSMQSSLQKLEGSFADGLSGAIVGALEGKKGNFHALAQNIGGQMIKLGVDQVLKQGIQGSGIGNLFGLGSGEAMSNAAAASKALHAGAKDQVAAASANADNMAKQITTASMAVTATTVNINGSVTGAAAPGGGATPAVVSSSASPQDVNIAAVSGTALTAPTIPFTAPGAAVDAGASAMSAAGAALPAATGLGARGLGLRAANQNSPFGDLSGARTAFSQQGVPNPFQQGVPAVGQNPGIGGFGVEAFRKLPASDQTSTIPNGLNAANKSITLSQADIHDMAKVVNTEVAPGLAKTSPEQYALQRQGVVDTMTNRMSTGKYDNVDQMLNERRQFSKITGPDTLNPYGSVAKTPDAPAKMEDDVQRDLLARANGSRQDVTGGYQHYLNPVASDQSNLNAWGNHVVAQGRGYGVGQNTQFYGGAPGEKPVDPYKIKMPGANDNIDRTPTSSIPKVDTKQMEQAQQQLRLVQQQGNQQQLALAKKSQIDMNQVQTQAGAHETQLAHANAQQQLQVVQQSGNQTVASFKQTGAGVSQAGADAQTAGPQFQTAGQDISSAGQQAQSGGGDMGGFGQSIAGLAGPLASGKQGMGSFAQAALSMVSKMLSGMGGMGGGGGGGLFGGLFGGMHSGGLVGGSGMYSTSHVVSPAIFANAQRYHTGLNSDEYPAILQRGERVLTANDNARNTALLAGMSDHMEQLQRANSSGQQGGGGGNRTHNQTMNMTIQTPNADSFRKSSSQLYSDAHVKMNRASGKST